MVKRSVKTKRGQPAAAHGPIHIDSSEVETVISAAAAALPAALQGCSTNVTPECIKALYGIPSNATSLNTPGNSLGLYQQGSYFAESDVNAYFKSYAPYVPQGTFPINASIDGASYSVPLSSELNNGEANIDIEMA